jgi:hypothetical protein
LTACKSRAPAEAAASALQFKLAPALQQARDFLGDCVSPFHVAWAAAHVGLDASGALSLSIALLIKLQHFDLLPVRHNCVHHG